MTGPHVHVLWLLCGILLLAASASSYTFLLKRVYTDRTIANYASNEAAFARYKDGVERTLQMKADRISELSGNLSTITRERDLALDDAKMWQRNSREDRAELQTEKTLRQKAVRQMLELPDGISTDGPTLWIDYKPAGEELLEKLVFSTDKGTPLKVRDIGPLVWRGRQDFDVTTYTAIGVVRDSVECTFIASEKMGTNSTSSSSLPDGYRRMMQRFGVQAQPTLDVVCEDMAGTSFLKRFILSIDPHNRIVFDPAKLDAI